MGGNDSDKAKVVQSLLLVSGLNTLFQSFFGTRLPALVLSSYAYVIPATSIVISSRYASIVDPHEKFEKTMRGIQGALIITALFQGIIGFMGFWRVVVRLLSPLSVVPLVTFTGLGLSLLGFPLLANCVEIGLPAIFLMLLFSQYLVHLTKSKADLFDRYAVLFSVAAIWVYAVILTASGAYSNKPINTQTSCRTDRAGLITGAPWIYVPYPFQWGKPTFNPGEAFAMMAASVVALIESTGAFFALSRYGSATPVPPSVISRGAGWLGVGVILDGFFGTLTGSTISVENAGLLALTKVGSRRVSQMSALFMILSSIFGKFGAFFASIPSPILAAVNCICFGYVSSVGLDFLQFCNLNSFRTKSILGFSFFMGISIPQYFNQYHSNSRSGALYTPYTWFNDLVNVIFMSSAAVAVITALILDCTVGRKEESTRKDSGLHWWEKFYSYNTDVRSDEFYALPCKLNQYFPVI